MSTWPMRFSPMTLAVLLGASTVTLARYRVGQVNLTISDLFFVAALLGAIANPRQWHARGLTGVVVYDGLWYLGSLLIILGLGISGLFHASDLQSATIMLQYLFAWLLLPYLLASVQPDQARGIAMAYSRGFTGICAVSLLIYFAWPASSLNFTIGHGRMASFLDNPNELAKTIAVSSSVLVLMHHRAWVGTAEFLLSFLVLGTALVCTVSFGGLVGYLVFWGIIVASGVARRYARFVVVALVSVTGGFLLFGLPAAVMRRVLPVIGAGTLTAAGSQEDKAGLMAEAWNLIGRNPFVGIGAGQYDNVSQYGYFVHNTYLLLWAEGGIFAVSGLLVCMASIVLFARAIHRSRRFDAVILFAAVATFLVNAITNTHVYSRHWSLPLLVLVLAVAAGRGEASGHRKSELA